MQGSGISSDSIWTVFNSVATSAVRYPAHALRISWLRSQNTTRSACVVDSSTVDGPDLILGQSSVITQPDYFDYFNEDIHAINLEYDRSIDEPTGGIAYTLADVLLDNTSLRFTPDYNATVGTALLPNRPIKMLMGFTINGTDRLLPIVYGTTRDVREEKTGRTVSVSAYDYIYYINNYRLESTIYENKRTDEIIADILNTMGFAENQYNLDEGLNVIPFAWFEKNQTAGSRIRQLMESEEGTFYQDEAGVIQFKNRRTILSAPYNASVWTINPEDILYWEADRSAQTINRAIVSADVRSVKSSREVWRLGAYEILPNASTTEIWVTFEDPVTSINALVEGVDYFANTKTDGSGTDVSSSISVVVTVFTTSAKVEVTNSHGSDVALTFLKLSGTPATIDSLIEEVYEDTDSQDDYGQQPYVIENDYINSQSFAYYLARAMVRKYKDPRRRIRLTVMAVPQLQLLDRVAVKDRDTDTSTDYRLMRIQGTMSPFGFYQTLTLREITGLEAESPSIVDTSVVDSTDVVWI